MIPREIHPNPVLLLDVVASLHPTMSLEIISWNVIGINNTGRRLNIRNLLQKWKPEIVCFQETKMEQLSAGIVQGLCGGPFKG
jgi:hypothetical protein